MTVRKMKLTKDQVDLLTSLSGIFFTGETHSYYRTPWIKLEIGSDEAELLMFEKDYPEDLKKALGPNIQHV